MPFAIGIENVKKEVNVGTLIRSAVNFNANLIFTIGRRYKHQCSDTTAGERHIPIMHFPTWEDYRRSAPYKWMPIGVEITPSASNLVNFVHPKQAVYFLGPEDGSLSQETLRMVKYTVFIPSKHCLNVSVAGSIVMFDRLSKE